MEEADSEGGEEVMGMALQCDACGKVYTAYNTKRDPKKPSGIMPINIDNRGKFWTNDEIFLCPECMTKIQNCIEEIKNEA